MRSSAWGGVLLVFAIAGTGCIPVGDTASDRCYQIAERQIGVLRNEALKLIPTERVASAEEFVGCDSADNGASLDVQVSGDVPPEEMLRPFYEKGWKPLPRDESALVPDKRMCRGCVAGVMRDMRGKVIYVAVGERENGSGNRHVLIDYQGLGLFEK
ncbi:hypothetical protein AB0M95_31270 [Sphaerisporangium sp. NPDC051017]|uniref:hypothetical protein n=1 Tax=Sphaerisporangium sp. NPDC051017 TaxID=3154636 RepID=UPI003423039D